jgi:Ser/Thr protein kinase RdoA (MazF antagonist)
VVEYLIAIRDAGVDVPEVLGRDAQGRQITEFVPGRLALDADPLTAPELTRVGAMVRAIHDASDTFRPAADAHWDVIIPAPGSELVCHNDLAPWNLIIGERWVFIDWDGAGPSTRLWDLAYAAQAFTLSDPEQDPPAAAANLAAFVDGYQADGTQRAALPATMHRRATAMHELLRASHRGQREPWASMYLNGHGQHWADAAAYVGAHHDVWAEALRHRDR